jgi:alcohol oxidase
MKPRDKGGVVDERLNVYGTTNLKCVDLSICPDNLGTNTWVEHGLSWGDLIHCRYRYSSALLVGEKGADLLAEDLGECLSPIRVLRSAELRSVTQPGLQLRVPHAPVPHAPIPTGKPNGALPRHAI